MKKSNTNDDMEDFILSLFYSNLDDEKDEEDENDQRAIADRFKPLPKPASVRRSRQTPVKLFYDPELIILPKYKDLTAPKYVCNQIKQFVRAIDGDYYPWNAESSFWYTSLENRNTYKDRAQFVSLAVTPVSFSMLGARQLSWYLFWRKEVLKRNFIETDHAYILFFVDELLSYTFSLSAPVNISMLERLREKYSDLAPYISSILYDLLIELNEISLAQQFAEYRSPRYTLKNPEEKLYGKLKQAAHLKSTPITAWLPYFHNTAGAFFDQHRKDIYKTFKTLLDHYETYLAAHEVTIESRWFTETKIFQPVKLFLKGNSAIPRTEINFGQTCQLPNDVFKEDVRYLSMLAEMMTGGEQHADPLLDGFMLSIEDHVIATPKKKAKTKDTENFPAVHLNRAHEPVILDPNKIAQLSTSGLASQIESPPETPPAPAAAEAKIEITAALTEIEQDFLALFQNRTAAIADIQAYCLAHMLMPAQLIKQINNKFADTFDNPLILLTEDHYRLTHNI